MWIKLPCRGGMLQLSRRRLSTIGGVCLLLVYFYLTMPPPGSETGSLAHGYTGKHCKARRHFGNLTDTHYFVFIKAKYGDDDVLSNMFFYLGLKYGRTFAMNIDRPMSWYGLSTGNYDSSYLQSTKTPPKILAQELDYDPSALDKLLNGNYQISPKVVVGFLRDPYDVFMSCLLRLTQKRRQKGDVGVSMMLDQNVIEHLNSYENDGNFKRDRTYIGYSNCNNQLAHSLGLNNHMYQTGYNFHTHPDAAERFADLVERRVTHFLIYEKLTKAMFMLMDDYCLYPDQDFLFLSRLPESYVGIGLGTLKPETMKRLEHFLQFDYAIYNRMNQKFDKQFASRLKNPKFVEGFQVFRDKQIVFSKSCCKNALSLNIDDMKRRAYGLTEAGSKDLRCSMLNGGNMLLSNMVFQLQEYDLTSEVSELINKGAEYQEFLLLISNTLSDDDEKNEFE